MYLINRDSEYFNVIPSSDVILPTGTYPEEYHFLKPMYIYNEYYKYIGKFCRDDNWKYIKFHYPNTLNVNSAIVTEYWEIIPRELYRNGEPQGDYYVSSFGRIYSIKNKRILQPFINKSGYISVSFHVCILPIHRVVLYTFNPIPNFRELTVNHISCNTLEPYLWNLEWCTMKENVKKSIELGNRWNPHFLPGDKNNKAKISEDTARGICEMLLSGYKYDVIAKKYNTSAYIVKHIRNRESFGYLYDEYNLSSLYGKRLDRIE